MLSSSPADDFFVVDSMLPHNVQDLLLLAKKTSSSSSIEQILAHARSKNLKLVHFAAAIGDRPFFGLLMTFLPLESLLAELQTRNENDLTPLQCGAMYPSVMKDVKSFLVLHGVLSQCKTSPHMMLMKDDADLKRVEVGRSRYFMCPNTESTVGETLRANGIYYAVVNAVYIRQTCFEKSEILRLMGINCWAFPDNDDMHSFRWSGPTIANLAAEESFRAAYKIYAPCQNANQQIGLGMPVLLDVENISPPLSAASNVMILRYFPSPGTLDTNTATHHNICVSDSGVRVFDKGYRDDDFLKGFQRGWYGRVYWRAVGDYPNRFLSGGDASGPYKFNIREEHDFGYDNKRVMIKLPDEGIVYCRGVGDDSHNPVMACVLFDAHGNVRDRYGYMGLLGRWNNIVH